MAHALLIPTEARLIELPTITAFLLIQDNKILDVNSQPHKLNFSLLNEFDDWAIFAGCKNEFGNKEIAGMVAKVWCKNAYSNYIITVKCMDYESHVECVANEPPSTIVAAQLQRMSKQGQLMDPINLGKVSLFAL